MLHLATYILCCLSTFWFLLLSNLVMIFSVLIWSSLMWRRCFVYCAVLQNIELITVKGHKESDVASLPALCEHKWASHCAQCSCWADLVHSWGFCGPAGSSNKQQCYAKNQQKSISPLAGTANPRLINTEIIKCDRASGVKLTANLVRM